MSDITGEEIYITPDTVRARRGRGHPSAQEGNDIRRKAVGNANAGDNMSEGKGRQERTERKAQRILDTLEEFRGYGQKGFAHLDYIAQSLGVNNEMMDEIRRILDVNNDGKVSDAEVAEAGINPQILNEVAQIHPVMARALRDKNFRLRKIEREPVKLITPSRKSNQVNTILQGYAGYEEDINKFNVNF